MPLPPLPDWWLSLSPYGPPPTRRTNLVRCLGSVCGRRRLFGFLDVWQQPRAMYDRHYLDLVWFDAIDDPVLLEQQLTKVAASELRHHSARFWELNQRLCCRHHPLGEEPGIVLGVAPDAGTDVSQVSACRRRPD